MTMIKLAKDMNGEFTKQETQMIYKHTKMLHITHNKRNYRIKLQRDSIYQFSLTKLTKIKNVFINCW